MTLRTSLLKPSLLTLSVLSISTLSSQAMAEPTPLKKAYQEPTRGFFIEHGVVAPSGEASVELHTGDNLNSGGGIRLGLPNAELIINSGFDDNAANEALLKWALPRQNKDGTKQTPLNWAVLAGLSQLDIEDENNNSEHSTSLLLGLAMTVKADAGLFTATPKLVHTNSHNTDDDTFAELDLGAYVGLIETEAGLFSAGVEANFTSEDNRDNTFALGMRWAYNERLTLDFVPVILSDSDLSGVPGLVRLNVNF
jgi:hypothetical protein